MVLESCEARVGFYATAEAMFCTVLVLRILLRAACMPAVLAPQEADLGKPYQRSSPSPPPPGWPVRSTSRSLWVGQRRWGSGPHSAASGYRAYWLHLDAKGHGSGHVALFTQLFSPSYLQADP